MKFGPVPLAEADGQVLAHNISDDMGRRVLRKGRTVDADVIAVLSELGYSKVYVAELEEGDIGEDEASERVARVVAGPGVECSAAHAGRVNLTAGALGVLGVDVATLIRLNAADGITVATLSAHTVVRPGQRVATVKVIPYALSSAGMAQAEFSPDALGIVSVRPIPPTPVAVVLVGSRGVWASLEEGLGRAIARRLEALGCHVSRTECAPLDEVAVSEIIRLVGQRADAGMVIVGGETAIMDQNDLIPRALRLAGGQVEHLGLAMDPGHLLLLGYVGDVPVVGAPGCVRGTAPDGFDAVAPRLLAGERLGRGDLERLGHGGLLSDPRARADSRSR